MTVVPENRFTCDRCGDSANQPMTNNPPHARIGGPEGWLMLGIGTDPSTPPSHLCPPCAFGFKAYIKGAAIMQPGMFKVSEDLRTDAEAAP